MRPLLSLLLLGLVVAACGGSDTQSDPPRVEILRLEADGRAVLLEFVVEEGAGEVTVTLDWGDGSPEENFIASGSQAAAHEFPADIDEAVVTVTVTDGEGRQTRASRAVSLSSPTTTSSTVDTSSTPTSTVTSQSTTTTTAAATTTTVRRTTTTSSATATTLRPEEVEQVYHLQLANSTSTRTTVNPHGADGTARHSGASIHLEAETWGLDGPVSAASEIEWLIPESSWSLLGESPRFIAVLEFDYELKLETGPNPGRSAAFTSYALSAANRASGAFVEIGHGDSTTLDTSGSGSFATVLPVGSTGPIRIVLHTSCAVSEGSTVLQVGEHSLCRADVTPQITVTLTRTEGT